MTTQQAIFILNEPMAPRLAPHLAQEIGLNESILLLQLEFWIRTSGKEHDGKMWVYESVTEIRKVFPFWGRATINRIIHSLEEKKLIHIGNFNQHKYDRTRWFSLNPEGCSELQAIVIADTPFQNGTTTFQNGTRLAQNGTTIPDLSSDLSPDQESPNGDTPRNFQDWHSFIREAENDKARVHRLRMMCECLYPGLDPPDYSYVGIVAKRLHAGRMADLLWQCAPHPPTGDLLAYIQKVARNGRTAGQNSTGTSAEVQKRAAGLAAAFDRARRRPTGGATGPPLPVVPAPDDTTD